ncbi:MAG: FAD-binding oxidoreductase [Phycisphaerales bacterium]|nr:FAD-binding oxidoreductase [Phycisphaerales bacterium]
MNAAAPLRQEAHLGAYDGLRAQVREAAARGAAIFVSGGGGMGESVPEGAVRVDTRCIADVIDHARADMTVTVQAGLTAAALAQRLRPTGQQLALDIPRPATTTIGAIVALSLGGSRRLGCGGVRDQLLGVRVINADGELIRGGGRVVKNVAGYDLCKLYAQSRGWLGVIVEATFRLAALPEQAGAVVIPASDAEAAERLCADVLRGDTRPTSLDVLSAAAARAIFAHTAGVAVGAAPLVVVAGFAGSAAAVRWQISELAPEARSAVSADRSGGGRRIASAVLDGASYERFCADIADLAYFPGRAGRGAEDGPGRVVLRAVAASDRVTRIMTDLAPICADGPTLAHIANGVIAAHVRAERCRDAADVVERAGGWWQFARAADAAAAGMALLGPPREDWGLMLGVKAALDERGVFGRGGAWDRAIRAGA